MTRALAIATLLAASAAPATVQAAPSPYVPGEILVKYGSRTASQHRAAAAAAHDHRIVAELRDGWTHLRIRPGESVPAALAAYTSDPSVERVQPNFIYRVSAVPNDPGYPQQWALRNTGQTIASVLQPPAEMIATGNPGLAGDDIHVEAAWGVTTSCTGAVVAVLDSGVNYLHEDLAANMWDGAPSFPLHGYDFVKGALDPMDRHGHGTHVAGIIGAVGNNAVGVSGVCWSARIMAVRVADELGAATTVSIVSGLDFAATHGAKVVNMSLGGGGTFDPAYSDAFTRAQAAGVLVVVAAGNEANDNDGATAVYPCKFTHPNIVCVAALDQSYALASFSNWGATSVDLGAPGTNILSTWVGSHGVGVETFASGWTGTSTTAGSGGGWDIKNLGGTDYLVDAADYGTFSYNPGTDDRAWKTYDLSAADLVTVTFQVAVDLADGDSAQLACKATGGDPFSGGTVLETETGVRTGQTLVDASGDLSSCIGPTMSFGVRLTSLPASTGNFGVVVAPITFKLLAYDTNSYNTIAGTSMASPVVAGVAALLRSYHPAYGYADVASALLAAGRPVASLAGKTTSGKAVDAMASLAYVHPPTGLAAVVH